MILKMISILLLDFVIYIDQAYVSETLKH